MTAGSKTAGRDRAARPQRSELSVPASSGRFFAKAAAGAADAVVLDLEDGVAEDRKDAARTAAIEVANTVDWGGKILSVRVNAIGTPWCHRDIVEVAAACPRLDRIVLPKAEEAFDVRFVAAHPRLEAVIFGLGDYMAEMQTPDSTVGVPNPDYAVPGAAGAPHAKTSGTTPWPASPTPAAPPASARSTPFTLITATRRACVPPPDVRGPWASRGSGRSTRTRSARSTRCSRRTRRA